MTYISPISDPEDCRQRLLILRKTAEQYEGFPGRTDAARAKERSIVLAIIDKAIELARVRFNMSRREISARTGIPDRTVSEKLRGLFFRGVPPFIKWQGGSNQDRLAGEFTLRVPEPAHEVAHEPAVNLPVYTSPKDLLPKEEEDVRPATSGAGREKVKVGGGLAAEPEGRRTWAAPIDRDEEIQCDAFLAGVAQGIPWWETFTYDEMREIFRSAGLEVPNGHWANEEITRRLRLVAQHSPT